MRRYKKNETYYFMIRENTYVRVRYEGKSNIKGQGYFWPIDSNWSLGACPDWIIKSKEDLTAQDKIVVLEV